MFQCLGYFPPPATIPAQIIQFIASECKLDSDSGIKPSQRLSHRVKQHVRQFFATSANQYHVYATGFLRPHLGSAEVRADQDNSQSSVYNAPVPSISQSRKAAILGCAALSFALSYLLHGWGNESG